MNPAVPLIPLAVAVVISLLVTPLVVRLAVSVDVVDRPTERSVSRRPGIPLLGGLAVAAAFGAALLVASLLLGVHANDGRLFGLTIGGLLILGLGVWDDRFGMEAGPKFAVQTIAAAVAVGSGLQIGHVTEPFSRSMLELPPWLGWLVSILWIVGITNAINLVDGLDGLASGVCAIIAATLLAIAWQGGHLLGVCLAAALLGALVGFLPYNFPPARIFLGDTGSLFIGYTLSVMVLDGYRQVSIVPFIVPLLALAVPILDTLLSIARRLWLGTPLFRADRLHMHHRLLAARGSARAAVLQIYLVTGAFCLIALSFTQLQGAVAALCLVAVTALTLRLLWNVGALSIQPDSPQASRGSKEKEA